MTYYILAAQTIYFKYYFNKSSFRRSFETSGSLAPRQSIKVLACLICPRHNNQCKTQWELQATLTLRVRLAWNKQVKSTSIAVSTRVRLSGSVGSNNLTTASSMQHRLISLQQTRIFFCQLKTKVWKGGLVETPHHLHAEQISEGIPPARELLAQDCNSSSAKKCHGSN